MTSQDPSDDNGLQPVSPHTDPEPDREDTTKDSSSKSAAEQTSTLSVDVRRSECQKCGDTRVRAYHGNCAAPIIQVDGSWICGSCGVNITLEDQCHQCGGNLAVSTTDVQLDLSPSIRPEHIEQAVHEETNNQRQKHGLSPLDYSQHLSTIALQHSRDMAQRDFFDHVTPDGKDVGDRYRIFEHDTRSYGENIAMEHQNPSVSIRNSAESIVEGWMNSPPHRENILKDQFVKEGIGIYCTAGGAVYATQNFY